jgi:DNA polymerase III delta prime subunit
LDYLRGSLPEASSESRTMLKDKAMQQGFACTVRIGSVAGEPKNYGYPLPKSNQHNSNRSFPRATQHVRNVFTALKVAESAGVYLRAVNDKPRNLNLGKCPWFYPMRLSVKELMSVLAWPLGDEDLPGVAELHPRILLVPNWYKSEERSFGLASGFPGERLKLGISARDSLEHTILLGPTGSGKSTAMLNLILADVMAGRSLLVIDPKADLVNDILARIPKSRISDVVVLDPTDTRPVGFNPLADHVRNPMLVADSVLAVLRDIFADSWGIRTQDILSAALLTLAKTEGASLIWLPALLTDVIFRQRIISKVVPDDPIGLGAFWSGFEAMSLGMQNQSVAPVMNKIRQFLLRPQLRVVLGQTNTKFSLNELFRGTGRKIVLVPLNKGVIGTESARLLGSLIVGQLWTLALERADLPPEQRHIVSLFIDEVQDYLHLPTDLADALAQARGLGVGLTLAHQYRAQLPPELRAGIDANTRNKIIFGLNANDARDMATMAKHDKLEAMDFELLPRFGVYAFLQQNGQATGWLSGSTFPAPPANASAAEVKAASQAKYGQDAETVEQELLELLGHRKAGNSKSESRPTNSTTNDIPIGRKKRGSDDG